MVLPYRVSLRVLGCLLNGAKARQVTLCEIEGGFLLHYCQGGDPAQVVTKAVQAVEVQEIDELLRRQRGKPEPFISLPDMRLSLGCSPREAHSFQRTHPLLAMGYETALRGLGEVLDRRHALAVTITELPARLYVEWTIDRADFAIRDGQRVALPGRRQETLTAAQIDSLLHRNLAQQAEQTQRGGAQLADYSMDVATCLSVTIVLEDNGRDDDAALLYRRTLALAPRNAELHFRLARYAYRCNDHRAALRHLEQAIATNDTDGRFYHLVGRVQYDRQQYSAAERTWQRAAACDPHNPLYRQCLQEVALRLGSPLPAAAGVAAALPPETAPALTEAETEHDLEVARARLAAPTDLPPPALVANGAGGVSLAQRMERSPSEQAANAPGQRKNAGSFSVDGDDWRDPAAAMLPLPPASPMRRHEGVAPLPDR